MKLKERHARFIEFYLATGDSREAAIKAGYPVKYASQEGSRLLKHPKISLELVKFRSARLEKRLEKTDFVDLALRDYESVEVTESNRPRFLQLAGQFAGVLGDGTSPQTVNNTQVNIKVDLNTTDTASLWDMARKLLA